MGLEDGRCCGSKDTCLNGFYISHFRTWKLLKITQKKVSLACDPPPVKSRHFAQNIWHIKITEFSTRTTASKFQIRTIWLQKSPKLFYRSTKLDSMKMGFWEKFSQASKGNLVFAWFSKVFMSWIAIYVLAWEGCMKSIFLGAWRIKKE